MSNLFGCFLIAINRKQTIAIVESIEDEKCFEIWVKEKKMHLCAENTLSFTYKLHGSYFSSIHAFEEFRKLTLEE